jgi:hypothetical protein
MCITFSVHAGGVVKLSANSGEFHVKTFGPASTQNSQAVFLRLIEFRNSPKWPSAAYVGFYEGENRDNSVQFLVIRNNITDDYMVSGYRIIENGREVKIESIANIQLNSKTKVNLTFNNGLVTIKLTEKNPISFQTSLKKVTPYVSVSSAVAEFDFGP